MLRAVEEIEAEHRQNPNPEVRGSTWVVSSWHDMNNRCRVFNVYFGADFDIAVRRGTNTWPPRMRKIPLNTVRKAIHAEIGR